MSGTLRVYPFTLTDSDVASEHVYAARLCQALETRDVEIVDSYRKADVVHLFEVNFLTTAALRAFNFPTLYRVLRSDTPLVVSTDDLYFTGEPGLTVRPNLYALNHRLQRWLFERSDAVIAISESVKKNLTPRLSTPIHVAHHGVADQYRSEPDTNAESVVLHVSLAAPRKNPKAVLSVSEQLEQGRFIVAGGGWKEYIPDPPANVEVRGYVPTDELIELYRRASVFYFPTLHEGFGLPLLEAMAAGTAVVSSDVYSVPEVVGDAGVLHDPRAVDRHVQTLNELLDDDERRLDLAWRGYKRAKTFTWQRSAHKTRSVYEAVT